jgi:citrate lyase subunit beta / citryl-CoA lyase
MRSLLFVPGDSEKKLARALGSGADVLLVDLEDSVAPERKGAARRIAADFVASRRGDGPRLFVRINDLRSGLADDDLGGVMRARPDGIMLPKSNSGRDVTRLSAKLNLHEARNDIPEGATGIIAIVTETAAGALEACSYRDASHRLVGMTWGAEDLSADIGARAARDETGNLTDPFRLARALTLLGAAAAGIAAVDTVFVDFRDEAGLALECRAAERDGFTAKMAIHPAQVPIINAAFTPSPEAIEAARRIVAAFAAEPGAGVLGIDGKMYDRPHLKRAQRMLAREAARYAG